MAPFLNIFTDESRLIVRLDYYSNIGELFFKNTESALIHYPECAIIFIYFFQTCIKSCIIIIWISRRSEARYGKNL